MRVGGALPVGRSIGIAVATVLAAALVFAPGTAQAQKKSKVSNLAKIVAGSGGQQAFSGSVQSLDLKDSVLNVHSVESDDVEIFPFKRSVRVDSANGEPLALAALKPGTSVLVYFEQRGDRRKVKQIIVLAAAPAPPKHKAAPPS